MVLSRRALGTRQPGFTLVELIVTLMIIGILAIAVVPRFNQGQAFEARSFYDQALSMVRYAQKAAIAQNSSIFVIVSAGTKTICLSYSSDLDCSGANGVPDPAGQTRYLHTVPAGVTFSGPVGFSFSPLGRPSQAAALGIASDGITRTITVEQETGYVH